MKMNQKKNQTNKVAFTLHTRAISAGRPQIYKSGAGGQRVGETPTYRRFKKEIEEIIENDIGRATIERYSEILSEYTGLKVKIVCHYQVKNHEFWGEPMLARPDLDNVAKALLDQVIPFFRADDGIIFDLHISKYYAKENSIDFEIEGFNIKPYVSLAQKKGATKRLQDERTESEKKESRQALSKRIEEMERRLKALD